MRPMGIMGNCYASRVWKEEELSMRVVVSATGRLKKFIPEVKTISIKEGITLIDLKTLCGMGKGVNPGYTINGTISHGSDILRDGDRVQFIMLVGAG